MWGHQVISSLSRITEVSYIDIQPEMKGEPDHRPAYPPNCTSPERDASSCHNLYSKGSSWVTSSCGVVQGADRAFAFTSGMAALVAVVRLVKAGEHILAGDDLYGGTSRLLSRVVPDQGVAVSNVDMTDIRSGPSPGQCHLCPGIMPRRVVS